MKERKNVVKQKSRDTQKAKDFWGTVKRLLHYMSRRVWVIVLVLVLAIIATIFRSVTPSILGRATTEIYRGFQEGQAMKQAGEVVKVMSIRFDLIVKILAFVFV